jgi:hypothetical protein
VRSRRALRFGIGLALALLAGSGAADGPSEAVDPSARLPGGDAASEYWDLTAHFDSGHRVYARFLITNEGPGSRNGVAIGHLIAPDGTVTQFQNGRRKKRWTLGPHRRRLQIGASLLELGNPSRRLQIVKQKKGIRILLEWAADASAAHLPQRDGTGYQLDLLNLGTPIAGSVWVRGMDAPVEVTGRAALTHTWITGRERDVALRRIDVATLGGPSALFVSDLTAPSGARWQLAAVAENGQIISVGQGTARAPLRDSPSGGAYPIPARLQVEMGDLTGSISLGDSVLRHDPLDALPFALRMVYSFKARPHRAWADAHIDVTLDRGAQRAALPLREPGVAALTFLDSLPVE